MATWGPTHIAADGDDAGQRDDGPFSLGGIDTDGHFIVYTGNPNYRFTAWRWDNVTVPVGATITAAKVTMVVTYATGTFPRTATWYGEDQDDPAGFTGAGDGPITRTRTTASAGQTWNSAPATGALDSVELKDIVQEIVSRAGWASGNAMIIMAVETPSASTGRFQVQDYANSTANAAELTITYTEAAGGGATYPARGIARGIGRGVGQGIGR
jgi:hypothetical protein